MLNQTYSAKNLRKLITFDDFRKYDIGSSKIQIEQTMHQVSDAICDDKFNFDTLEEKNKNGNKIFSPSTIKDEFSLRKLTYNLKRLYKFKQADRFLIIGQIISLLYESIPMAIVKLDIEKFYESINRSEILKKIMNDPLLSFKSKQILNQFFELSQIKSINGMPRGINVSAALSEIAMRDFDTRIKQLDGAYYYARYVDDIIIFTFKNPEYLTRKVEDILKKETGLSLNHKKTKPLERVTCRCKPRCKCATGTCKCLDKCICNSPNKATDFEWLFFEYLGYKFVFSDIPAHSKKLKISLASKKTKKFKSRIVYSFLDYLKTKDFELLEKRMCFISGNHIVKYGQDGGALKAGIFYNYQHINDYEVLDELTVFVRKLINSKGKSFGKKMKSNLSKGQKKELVKYNFKAGFINRKIRDYSAEEVNLIKNCWVYGEN